MSTREVFLTRDGFEKLMEELNHLKTERRREISKEIGKAIAHGDLSENAEYDAAKEAQALNERRIFELEDKLSRARIIEDEAIPADKVYIGARVLLKDLDSGEQIEYILVAEDEVDISCGKISVTSPIGQMLLGHKEKDKVQIKVPAGTLRYKVVKISR